MDLIDLEGAIIYFLMGVELMLFITTGISFIKDIWYGDEDEI